MPDQEPVAVFHYDGGDVQPALDFLKRTRNELRMLRKVRVWTDRLRVFDVNGDCFEVAGIGYTDDDIKPLLDALRAVYNPESIHGRVAAEFKEFKTGKAHPWAEDRVM